MAYTIQHINQIIKGSVLSCNSPATRIEHLLYDSRQLAFPRTALFFAFVGQRQDGHKFLNDLYEKGVRNFVVTRHIDIQPFPEANILLVDNCYNALQELASFHRQQFSIPVIGITGSNGKTIVKEWLWQLLRADYQIVRSPKSFNSQLGVPMSVWQIGKEHNLGIFEAGISTTGEMARLAAIIDCNIGIFTNIGEAHSYGFRSKKEKLREKLKLFAHTETIFYCKDDPLIETEIQKLGSKNWFTWSKHGPADLEIKEIKPSGNNHREIIAQYKGSKYSITIPFNDAASIENATHCWALMLYLGYDAVTIQGRMKLLEPVGMRLEMRAGANNCTIVNDSYNSDLTSLMIALNFVHQQSNHARRTIILSDILQSGQVKERLYKKVADLLLEKDFHRFFGIGHDIPVIRSFLPAGIEQAYYKDTGSFLEELHLRDFKDETILLKGARQFEFERIANRLAYRLHKTVLEVDLNALVHNLRIYDRFLEDTTRMMVMVKASAYGSGSLEVARLLEAQKVDYLAVAYADEGVELRKGGVRLPILVLNPEEASFDAIVRYQLEPEVYDLPMLQSFLAYVPKQYKALIHLKLDTGMHRLGFESGDIAELLEYISVNPLVEVRSVFSHLAASDSPEHDPFTHQQVAQFELLYGQIAGRLGYRPLRHICNTGGIVRFPQYQMDMVRLGIGLYGIDSSGIVQNQLQVVNTLKATISQIKEVKAKETVGYNRSGRVEAPKRIATISIGYADGLMRAAGNGRHSVYLHGQKAPIIGNVCMDMCMVDITHIPNASVGDEVEIFGKRVAVEDLAEALHTIPYEIFTGISARVKRSYFQE